MEPTTQTKLIERIYTIWGVILIVWALYRAFVQLPEIADEFLLKPLIFLGPVLVYVFLMEKRNLASIGFASGKFVRDLYLGIGFGLLFTLLGVGANFVKHGEISLLPVVPVSAGALVLALLLSLASAISEEGLVRGFLFTRLKEGYGREGKALLVSLIMYLFILVPVVFTRLHLTGTTLAIFVVTNIVLSAANTMIFSETKTLTIPILIHVFWNMVVLLYL